MKWRTSLIVFGIMFFLISISFADAWWDTTYGKRQTVNIEGGVSILTSFTALINVSYDSDMQADFDDLRFINGSCTSEGSTQLDYEYDKIINSNSALVWIRIPDLQIGTNKICMYYGNTGASNNEDMLNTWDSNYKGVYHFTEGSGTHIEDSTGNGNGTLSASGVTWNTTRFIGNSLLFDGAGDAGSFLNISNNTNARFQHPDVTLEVFGSPNSGIGNYDTLLSSGDGTPGATDFYWAYATTSGMRYGNDIGGWNSNFNVELNNVSYFAMAYTSGDFNFRLNNNSNTSSQTQTLNANSGLYVGQGFGVAGSGYTWSGTLDEVRISNVQRSDAWMNRSYDNLFYQNLVSFGTEEDQLITFNSVTYNSTTYEMSNEGFTLNITYDSTTWSTISANLSYNGTVHAGTVSGTGDTITFSTNLYIGTGNTGNRSFNWTVYISNVTTANSSSTIQYNQTVEVTTFGFCNTSLNNPYINFTFKDEGDLSLMDAFVDASTWNYWLSNTSDIQTFTFSNTTDQNPSYAFCSTPQDQTLNVNLSNFKYKNTTHPQRTYSFSTTTLTNTTTNQVLYLLGSDDGIYSAIQTQESSGATIPGVLISIEREINDLWVLIGQQTTGSDGLATFWVNPNFAHRITGAKTNYVSAQVTITPSQSTYTLVMSRSTGDATYNGTLKNMRWTTNPPIGRLNIATHTFEFNLTASDENLDGSFCKLELVDADNDSILSSSTGGNAGGCNLSISYTVINNQKIRGKYYVDTTDTDGFALIDGDTYWIMLETSVLPTTFFHFLDDLKNLPEFGDGLRQEYSRVVFFFFMLFLVIGLICFFTGYDFSHPGTIGIIIVSLIWLASFAGWFEFSYLTDYNTLNKYSIALITSFIMGGYILNYYGKQ